MEFFQKIRQSLEMKVIEEVLEDREPVYNYIKVGRRSGKNAFPNIQNFGGRYGSTASELREHLRRQLQRDEKAFQKVVRILDSIPLKVPKVLPEPVKYGSSTLDFLPGDRVELHPTLKGISKNPGTVVKCKFRDVLVRIDGFRKTIAVEPRHLRKIISPEDNDFV